MTARILVAGLWHETNTFSPIATGLAAFRAYQWAEGSGLAACYGGTNTEIGGMLAGLAAAGLTVVPGLFAGAIPSGTVTGDAFEALAKRIVATARRERPDGALLALHGAMVADGFPEADAELARRVRAALPAGAPLVATYDLHANISRALVDACDLLVGYDTFPHTDMGARGAEAAARLAAMLADGTRPAKAFRKLAMITVPQMQATAEPPMAAVMARVAAAEAVPGVDVVSVAQGFAYADVDHLGIAVTGYGSDPEALAREVDAVAAMLEAAREEFRPALVPVTEAVAIAAEPGAGPVVLVEPADNVGGGAPGDGTAILAELVRRRVAGTVVIWDPDAVAAARGRAGFAGPVGGRTLPALHGPPVVLEGAVVFDESAVRYVRDGAYMTGQQVPMGDVAVVRTGFGLTVVLTSERVMPFDDTHLRRVGIDPAAEPALVAKSGSAWKIAFQAIARRAVAVDTGGVCASLVERLPYTRAAARRCWPLR
ncbi:M81 family metallopeptidase [Thalassobaculum sp.]|uniref:M81 family metallopeptidase n=1 Tax=Thalassobaculum sp. TaxID=2022740 RepID=UPI0032EAF033